MTRLDEYATIIAACSLPTIKKKLFERNDKKEEAERNRTSVPELALLPPNPDYSLQISCVCVVCFVCGASTTRAQGHLSIGVYYRNISKRYK